MYTAMKFVAETFGFTSLEDAYAMAMLFVVNAHHSRTVF